MTTKKRGAHVLSIPPPISHFEFGIGSVNRNLQQHHCFPDFVEVTTIEKGFWILLDPAVVPLMFA